MEVLLNILLKRWKQRKFDESPYQTLKPFWDPCASKGEDWFCNRYNWGCKSSNLLVSKSLFLWNLLTTQRCFRMWSSSFWWLHWHDVTCCLCTTGCGDFVVQFALIGSMSSQIVVLHAWPWGYCFGWSHELGGLAAGPHQQLRGSFSFCDLDVKLTQSRVLKSCFVSMCSSHLVILRTQGHVCHMCSERLWNHSPKLRSPLHHKRSAMMAAATTRRIEWSNNLE